MSKKIEKDYHIKASKDKVWQALVDPDVVNRWGGGPATMSDEEGSEFKLWGGDIHGPVPYRMPRPVSDNTDFDTLIGT
ncbi:hypothetical protein CMO96_04730 [Candidatus Woesebacteria bacterium]|nr:hypothetical protein [Candidatus Woesebacteria bacterium]